MWSKVIKKHMDKNKRLKDEVEELYKRIAALEESTVIRGRDTDLRRLSNRKSPSKSFYTNIMFKANRSRRKRVCRSAFTQRKSFFKRKPYFSFQR